MWNWATTKLKGTFNFDGDNLNLKLQKWDYSTLYFRQKSKKEDISPKKNGQFCAQVFFRHASFSSTYPSLSLGSQVRITKSMWYIRISILSAFLSPHKASQWHCGSHHHQEGHYHYQGGRHHHQWAPRHYQGSRHYHQAFLSQSFFKLKLLRAQTIQAKVYPGLRIFQALRIILS